MRQIPRSAYIEPLVLSRTSFVGRTAHLAAVGRYLRSQQARLITLIGPGGVGKTRLALRAASLHADDFADGCHIVVLAEARTPETVLPAIARQLGLREEPHRSSADHLAHALRDQHLLLLLDNLEHVTAAAPSIAALLERCPRLTILATSRSPLRIQGEREYPVPPLLLPGLERLPPLDELRRCEAIALFIQRAQAVRPDFALTTANGPDIAEICTRLDGLPLAIELAAARLKVLSPQALLARLSGRLQLLTGGARDQPPRLQSLREAIAWSYDLLDPNEQSLFRRLAVFAGDFTLPAADAVGAEGGRVATLPPSASVFDGLTALVDHSLVQRSDRDEDEPRYRFLETIRMFALEQLAAAGEEAETRARHAAWCLELAETAAPALHEPPPARWLDQLATAEANLHAAQDWMLANRQWALGLRLAVALYDFWLTRGAGRDEAGWIERILAITPDALAGDRGLDHARVLNLLGVLRYYAGDHEAARIWYEASLTRRRTLGDQSGQATTLNNLAVLMMAHGDLAHARALYEQAIPLCRQSGDRTCLAFYLGNYVDVLNALGHHDDAWAALQESTDLWRGGGDTREYAYHLLRLGEAAHDRGETETARQIFEEALALGRRLGDERTLAMVLPRLSRIALAEHRRRSAAEHVVEALALGRSSAEPMLTVELFDHQAAVAVASDQAERAARLLGAADALYQSLGAAPYPSYQPERDRTVAAIQTTLGEKQAATLRALGAGLTVEQAIAEAVVVAGALDVPAPTPPHGCPTTNAGEQSLTRREQDILRLLVAGSTNREIGNALFLSHRTVATHVSNLLAKLDAPTRTGAVAAAVRRGLVDTAPHLHHLSGGGAAIDSINSVN